jgi:hypothetical protein
MDSWRKLVLDASESVAVVGRGGQFLVVPLTDGSPLSADLAEQIKTNHFKFCGCFGLVAGEPRVAAVAVDADSLLTLAAGGVYWATQLCCKRAAEQPQGDSVEWLNGLWVLRDDRD